MENKTLIEQTADFVKQELSGAEGGHDWWHVVRVWNNTRLLLQEENANRLICELGALLHDIADAKFHDGDDEKGLIVARQFLEKQHAVPEIIGAVIDIIQHVSFKGGIDENKPKTPELKVVQDADRLDAMGAIGIARTFNYGGFKNRKIYDPGVPPRNYENKDEYYRSDAPTINHFYEKLLLLKGLMNTKAGKRIAEGRHAFMEEFLQRFYGEWEGKM